MFTGSEIAAQLTDSLFSPITDQIDPVHMGEAWRSMAIGKEYGFRLMRKSRNFDSDGLEKLLVGYPSHGFVIDKVEARTIFRIVRDFTSEELALCEALGDLAEMPEHIPAVQCLSEEPKEQTNDDIKVQAVAPESPELGGSSTQERRDHPAESAISAVATD